MAKFSNPQSFGPQSFGPQSVGPRPSGAQSFGADTPVDQDLAGMAFGTRIMTLDGELPVEFLTPGDRVISRKAGVCILRALICTPVQNITLIRVSSGSLGHGRPGEDVLLAPGQRILLRDWRAKALYGQAQALVPLLRLIDGQYVSWAENCTTRLFTLQFDTAQVIYADGLELAAAGAFLSV